jgi:phage terminase Nu1 subunit (DNA packaging protein)
MAVVDLKQVSKALNVSERRVQQLAKEGLPKEDRGKYDLGKAMLWYIRYLQAALEASGRRDSGDEEYIGAREERARLLRAEAELKEMELAKQRGLLVAIADVERDWSEIVLSVKARIMAIPPRLAPEILGETSRVMAQAKIEKYCKEALAQLAKADDASGNQDAPKRQG